MPPRHPRFPLAALAAGLGLWACAGGESGSIAGGSGTDAGNALTVVAFDPDGAPAARAFVEAWPEDSVPFAEGALPAATGSTGTDGTVLLRLPSGRWSIVVRKEGRAWRRIVATGDTTRDTLRPVASIEGQVLGGGGLDVAARGLGRRTRCDASGHFAFDSLPSGRLVLVVRSSTGDIPRALNLAPSETLLAVLPSDTLRLEPRDTLEPTGSDSSSPRAFPSSRLGESGSFATAARLRRVSLGDSATLFAWSSSGTEGLRIGWRGLDTLRLNLPGHSPIEVAGIPLDTGSHLLGIGWTSGILGIWLDSGLVLSLSTQALSSRSDWSSSPTWGTQGVAAIDGVFLKSGGVPSDWFLQLLRAP